MLDEKMAFSSIPRNAKQHSEPKPPLFADCFGAKTT
jgi:hypothetical protein